MVLYETLIFKNMEITEMTSNEIKNWMKHAPFNIRFLDLHRVCITNEIYNNNAIFIRIFHFYDIFFKITYIEPEVLKHITKLMIYNDQFTPMCEIFVNRDIVFPLHQFLHSAIYIKVFFDHKDNIPHTFEFTYDAGSIINTYKREQPIIYPIHYLLNQEKTDTLHICIRNIELAHSTVIYRSNSCNYVFANGKQYKLLNPYDLDVELQFGSIVIYTNLLAINIIPCDAGLDFVILKSNASVLYLDVQVIPNEENPNGYFIDGVHIKKINNKWQEQPLTKRKNCIIYV